MRQLREALYRVRPLSWQRILEDSRLLMGLLLKIPLIVSDGLTKEVCLGLHYFAKQVVRLGRFYRVAICLTLFETMCHLSDAILCLRFPKTS